MLLYKVLKVFYKQKKLLLLLKVKEKLKLLMIELMEFINKKSPITAFLNYIGKVIVYIDEEAGAKIKEINKKF